MNRTRKHRTGLQGIIPKHQFSSNLADFSTYPQAVDNFRDFEWTYPRRNQGINQLY